MNLLFNVLLAYWQTFHPLIAFDYTPHTLRGKSGAINN